MVVNAIVLGPGGVAKFGQAILPPDAVNGKGQLEQRPPCDFGKWHTAEVGTATVIVVAAGKWEVEVPGEARSFGPGSIVVVQDGGASNENGHRSRATGTEVLVLSKTTTASTFPVQE